MIPRHPIIVGGSRLLRVSALLALRTVAGGPPADDPGRNRTFLFPVRVDILRPQRSSAESPNPTVHGHPFAAVSAQRLGLRATIQLGDFAAVREAVDAVAKYDSGCGARTCPGSEVFCFRGGMMSSIKQARSHRFASMVMACIVVAAMIMLSAGAGLAAPGRNNDSAKLCKNWASLYQEDGSSFTDRSDCTSYAAEGGIILTSTTTTTTAPPLLPNQVVVDAPSSAAGTYAASGAAFGPTVTQPIAGALAVVYDGTGTPTDGCEPLFGFPAGAIAVMDRGGCTFVVMVSNAQAAGAVAVVVANNVTGEPFTLGGADPTIIIPTVMVSQSDGATIKAGLPATGIIQPAP